MDKIRVVSGVFIRSLIAIFLLTTCAFAKPLPGVQTDSLSQMSFETLDKKFNDNIRSSLKTVYADAYYQKSKQQGDRLIRANGIYMKAYVAANENETLNYIESINALYGGEHDAVFPAKAYILKSNTYMATFSLINALDAILIAEKYANKTGNTAQQSIIKQQIGLIKIELGNYDEALPIILDNYRFFEPQKKSPDYFFAAWLLSDIYIRLHRPDEALTYINLALDNLDKKDKYYHYFLMYKGFCFSLRNDFTQSDALLRKVLPTFEQSDDKINLAECYYFLGENKLGQQNDAAAETYFLKVDAILKASKVNSLAFRKNYIRLIEIAKRRKDNGALLYCLDRLIEIDEKLHQNKVVLSQTINDQYDTPHLLAEKQRVLKKIEQEKWLRTGGMAVGALVILLGFYYLIRIRREKKQFEQKFNELIASSHAKPAGEKVEEIVETKTAAKNIELSEEIVNSILQQLAAFEKEQEYRRLNLKAADLARQFNTNTTYLSNVINHYKHKNFSQYVNDLRVDFAIQKLKQDKNFRKFTVKAISEEAGFNNAESFAKAFNSKTGIQPSYFIKKLTDIEADV